MKTKFNLFFILLLGVAIVFPGLSCKKDKEEEEQPLVVVQPQPMNFNSAKISCDFSSSKSTLVGDIVNQTPAEYVIALKSATLVGDNGDPDFELFDNGSLANSEVYDFTSGSLIQNLGEDTTITEAFYGSIEIELYYLQMKIQIHSVTYGEQWRNIRIYFSDDGTHRPGDMCEVDDYGIEIGWLGGNGVVPDFSANTPRTIAYKNLGTGLWLMFADKSAEFYGPFASMDFWTTYPTQPFIQDVDFTFTGSSGSDLVINFNVLDCWQFEDKTEDGYFGGDDLSFDSEPTDWAMIFPVITVGLE